MTFIFIGTWAAMVSLPLNSTNNITKGIMNLTEKEIKDIEIITYSKRYMELVAEMLKGIDKVKIQYS